MRCPRQTGNRVSVTLRPVERRGPNGFRAAAGTGARVCVRGFFVVGAADAEIYSVGQPTAVGCGDLDLDLRGLFMIQRHALAQAELSVHDLEAVVGDLKCVAVAGVGIADGDGAHHGPRSVLGDGSPVD